MLLKPWITSLFKSPSVRQDSDYSKKFGAQARTGVFLVYRDFISTHRQQFDESVDTWLNNVQVGLSHLHHELLRVITPGRHPFENLTSFLTNAPTEAFLDFLEVSFGPHEHSSRLLGDPTGNDLIGAINAALERHNSPYLLTPYSYRREETFVRPDIHLHVATSISAYPQVYLKQSGMAQEKIIQPVLNLLSDPAFEGANSDFRKALARYRSRDFNGVATSCVAALESVIKVASTQRRVKISGSGLKTLAQSFLSKAGIPHTLRKPIDFLADARSQEGDAHGHENKGSISGDHANFLINLTACLILYLTSDQR